MCVAMATDADPKAAVSLHEERLVPSQGSVGVLMMHTSAQCDPDLLLV